VIDVSIKGELPMALYELRTYTLHVGKMAEAVKLYQEIGFPALQKGGQDKKLVGYFQSDRRQGQTFLGSKPIGTSALCTSAARC
jgi:hypothetical protein